MRRRRFDPERRPLRLVTEVTATLSPVDRPPGSASPGRFRLALAGAAALVLLVAAATVAVLGPRDEDPTGPSEATEATGATTTTTTAPSPSSSATVPPVPDGVLMPAAVPDDLDLWAVQWTSAPAAPEHLPVTDQLFGRDGDTVEGAVHLRVQPGGGPPVGNDPTTVRGHTADRLPAKDFPTIATTLSWSEAGATVDATFTGIDLATVQAMLDGLTWREADPLAGFAPTGGAGFELLGEARPGDPATVPPEGATVVTGLFHYLDDARTVSPGEGRQLQVRTGTGAGAAGPTSRFLLTWFAGERRADGSVEAFESTFGTVRRDWPDGRSPWIDADGSALGEAELTAIAGSIAPATAAELTARREEATARVADQALTESADVGAGRLEVRGDGPTRALCLVPTGDDRERICPRLPTWSTSGSRRSRASWSTAPGWRPSRPRPGSRGSPPSTPISSRPRRRCPASRMPRRDGGTSRSAPSWPGPTR